MLPLNNKFLSSMVTKSSTNTEDEAYRYFIDQAFLESLLIVKNKDDINALSMVDTNKLIGLYFIAITAFNRRAYFLEEEELTDKIKVIKTIIFVGYELNIASFIELKQFFDIEDPRETEQYI